MTTLATILSFLFQIYSFLILIRVLLSWVNVNPYRPVTDHPAVRILHQITDPVIVPLQRVIPLIGGTIDISPVVALILLEILRRVLVGLLLGL
jgi:YggT family protein